MKHILAALVLTAWCGLAMAEEARLTWMGHAAFKIKTASGKIILIDPWISNPKAPKDLKIEKADIILVTHGHSDHVGEAFDLAKKTNATLIASYELTEIAKANGVKQILPINPSGSQKFGDLTITATEAVHSSSYTEKEHTRYAGAPLGFILQEKGLPTIYHAGDTGVFASMATLKDLYRPEIALVPIGGVFTMKPKEAAKAAQLLGVKFVVPMHFGTFPILTGTPADLRGELLNLPSIKVKDLTIGKETTLKSLMQ